MTELMDPHVALETAISIARASMLERQRAGDIAGACDAQREMLDLLSQRAVVPTTKEPRP